MTVPWYPAGRGLPPGDVSQRPPAGVRDRHHQDRLPWDSTFTTRSMRPSRTTFTMCVKPGECFCWVS